VQAIADQFDAATIETAFRKWLARVPHPFTPAQTRGGGGYRYQLSILQAEFALTQVLDRPATGRAFFEEVIRENLDVGRPDQVQLIFDRRVIRSTRALSHPRADGGRDAVAARGLQDLADQAVPQGGPGPPHRDHGQ